MSLIECLLEELRKDVKARRRFLEFIASEIALQPELRSILIKSLIPEIVTRRDLREELSALEARLKEYVDSKISELHIRMGEMEKRLNQRMDEVENKLSQRINEVEKILSQRISEVEKGLSQRIDEVEMEFNQRMSSMEKNLSQRIDYTREHLEKRIDDLYRIVRVPLISLVIALAASILIPLIIKLITKNDWNNNINLTRLSLNYATSICSSIRFKYSHLIK